MDSKTFGLEDSFVRKLSEGGVHVFYNGYVRVLGGGGVNFWWCLISIRIFYNDVSSCAQCGAVNICNTSIVTSLSTIFQNNAIGHFRITHYEVVNMPFVSFCEALISIFTIRHSILERYGC